MPASSLASRALCWTRMENFLHSQGTRELEQGRSYNQEAFLAQLSQQQRLPGRLGFLTIRVHDGTRAAFMNPRLRVRERYIG